MTVRELLKILRRDGWFVDRQQAAIGNSTTLANEAVTVVGKPSKTLHPTIVSSIMKQAQLENS